MAIEAGQRLLHYRLIEKIGEGGMGVVWKALDTELNRHVALKILPPELIGNEERRLRFKREAQTAAALSHGNIAVIHGVGDDGGVQFLAMEYVEGVTLREHVARHRADRAELLRIALQIAEGLAHAHTHGVVHRDVKPDNVMITTEGRVKILDFGLAKLLEAQRGAEQDDETVSDAEALDTISRELTRAGKVYGTVSYMSPEQARGATVDSRSDLFSFGIVLHEMLTGKPPFSGDGAMDTLSAILRERHEPVVATQPDTPAELQRILDKCLEKNPRDRYQDTRDLVVDLRRLRRETDSQPVQRVDTTSGVQVRPASSRRPSLVGVAGALAVVAVVVAAVVFFPSLFDRSPDAPQALTPIQLTANPPGNPVTGSAISPDGKYLAYADYDGIYFRILSSGEDHRLQLEEGFCFR